MNKKFIFYTLSIITAIFVLSILILKPKENPGIVTESKTHTERYYLTADTTRGSILIDINIEIPLKYKNEQILSSIQTQVYEKMFGNFSELHSADSVLGSFVREVKNEYVRNNIDFADKLSADNKLTFNNTFILEGFSLLNDENIFTYGVSREIDLGGTYPAKTRYFYNFDLKTGQIITEKEIFRDSFEIALTELIKSKMFEDSKLNEDIPGFKSFEDSEYIIEAIRPNGNFYINDEGICYVFNPYEIAPVYYVGETEVRLSYKLIGHLLRDNSPVKYLSDLNEQQLNN